MDGVRAKQTQKQQFEILVDFMVTHPELAKGLLKTPNAKTASINLWKRLTCQLNASGPPMRDMAGWKKVWADYKLHLKAKMRRNRINISGTGGGPSSYSTLTQLEQQVSELLSMEQSVTGLTGARQFGIAQAVPEIPIETPVGPNSNANDAMDSNDQENEEVPAINEVPTPRKKQSLLEKQVENQIEYQRNSTQVLSDINLNLKKIFKTMKKGNKIEKKKLKLAEEKFLHKQKIDHQNLKLNLSKLEIKKEMLNVEIKANNAISKMQ